MFNFNGYHRFRTVGAFDVSGPLERAAHGIRSSYEYDVIVNLHTYCNMDGDCQSIVIEYLQLDNRQKVIANVIAARLQMERKHWHMRRDMESDRSAHEFNARYALYGVPEGTMDTTFWRNKTERDLDLKLRKLHLEFTVTERQFTDMLELACRGRPIRPVADPLLGSTVTMADYFIDGRDQMSHWMPRLHGGP